MRKLDRAILIPNKIRWTEIEIFVVEPAGVIAETAKS
jgi:hypothetical protein